MNQAIKRKIEKANTKTGYGSAFAKTTKALMEDATETQLQYSCVSFLHQFALPDVIYLHIPNGGRRTKGQNIHFYRMGELAGFPDFLLIKDKLPHGLEFKVRNRKLTEQQEKVRDRFKAQGLPYAVIRTVDGFIEQMKMWHMVNPDIEISV